MTETDYKKIEKQKCFRCGYIWYPHSETVPKHCPKCNSPYWKTPKTRNWKRDDHGYLVRELTDEKILALMTDQYQTPHQIADKLACSMAGAQQALKRMHEGGLIDGGLFGNRWLYRKCTASTASNRTVEKEKTRNSKNRRKKHDQNDKRNRD